MALPEIEFELSADQYRLLDHRGLRQGTPLTVILDGGVLLPEPAAEHWYGVRPEPLPGHFARVGPALYAFAGRIDEAEIEYGREQFAHLSVDCGVVPLRITCAPGEDGMLPHGTWETRFVAGLAHVRGMTEESAAVAVGRSTDVTLWSFRRLVLTPGDAAFGVWHDSADLVPAPFTHDRVYVTARVHRRVV